MISMQILGGFQEYGKNCFLIEHQETGTRIMLDCGVQNGQPEVYPPLHRRLPNHWTPSSSHMCIMTMSERCHCWLTKDMKDRFG